MFCMKYIDSVLFIKNLINNNECSFKISLILIILLKLRSLQALLDRFHVVHGFGHDSDIVSCATHNRPINRLPRSSHRKNAQKLPKVL